MKPFVHCAVTHVMAARFLGLRFWSSPQMHAINTLLIVLFGLLHIADGVVTYLGLSFTSVDEVNPVLNYFAGILGLGVAITMLKLLILFVITCIYIDRQTIKGRLGTATLAWADTFYSWVVTNNFILVSSI